MYNPSLADHSTHLAGSPDDRMHHRSRTVEAEKTNAERSRVTLQMDEQGQRARQRQGLASSTP